MGKAHASGRTPSPAPADAPKGRMSRFALFLVVCALIAAAFGGGALWGALRTRAERQAWQKERAGLEERIASQAKELAAATVRDVLYTLDEGLSKVLIDLAEKNYGLARDEAATLADSLTRASADLPESSRASLAELGPVLAEIGRAADAVSPDARSAALRARDLLSQLISGTQPVAP
jgi:hypothetical protein